MRSRARAGARRSATSSSRRRTHRFGITGWKVQADLPNAVNYDAATAFITPDDMAERFACGRDVARCLEVTQQFVDAGFDRLALVNAGPDPDGFFAFFAEEPAEPIRDLRPG